MSVPETSKKNIEQHVTKKVLSGTIVIVLISVLAKFASFIA